MGVSGLWDILSDASKIYSLEELALDRLQRNGRGLRVAIDVSIWNIQAQAAQGGVHANLRTMFYRCCRLYSLGIRPVFVFDGDQRPTYKRHRNIDTRLSNTTDHHLLIAMLNLFNFAIWQAAGEAEAECAVLQRLGYVDIIFTTDVDVFLFGGQRVARNWPGSEHDPVICVDMDWIHEILLIDRSDMILMALLGGSDYSSGVNRIGLQAAKSLTTLKYHTTFLDTIQQTTQHTYQNDEIILKFQTMIDQLIHELHTNHSGYLRRKLNNQNMNGTMDETLITYAKNWIHPKTAILDEKHIEAAKTMNTLLNDQAIAPQFTALACFCQTQFSWSKSVTIDKFARKLYSGYMLQRVVSQARRLSQRQQLHSRQESSQERNQKYHPYFDRHYPKRSFLYSSKERQQPMDLKKIHGVEHHYGNRTGQGSREIKLSRCRVEWDCRTLETFLSMVRKELLDNLGDDVDDSTQVALSIDNQYEGYIETYSKNNQPPEQQKEELFVDKDDTIDLTVKQVSPAPAVGRPPSQSLSAEICVKKLSPTACKTDQTKESRLDYTWISEYCDPSKCCRQWMGYELLRKAYPKIVDDYVTQANKRKQQNKKASSMLDNSQTKLDSFFVQSRSS